jgi:hypothetical protein
MPPSSVTKFKVVEDEGITWVNTAVSRCTTNEQDQAIQTMQYELGVLEK